MGDARIIKGVEFEFDASRRPLPPELQGLPPPVEFEASYDRAEVHQLPDCVACGASLLSKRLTVDGVTAFCGIGCLRRYIRQHGLVVSHPEGNIRVTVPGERVRVRYAPGGKILFEVRSA